MARNNTATYGQSYNSSDPYEERRFVKTSPARSVFNKENAKSEIQIKKKNIDSTLAVAVGSLVFIGILMVFSSSLFAASTEKRGFDTLYFVRRQTIAAVIGFVSMHVVLKFRYQYLKLFALPLYILSNILLVLVQFVTEEVNGAHRWFDVPIVGSVQPSEIAKIGLILFLSLVVSRQREVLKTWKSHGYAAFLILITASLVAWGNLSTGIVVFVIGAAVLFIASPYIFRFIALISAGGLGVAAFIIFGDPFRMDRIQAWLNPEAFKDGTGYQTLQSLYAIGSGGLFGLGLGQSRQKMGFIPEAHTDIIFSIVCEEFGFLGALLILSLFAILIWRGIKIALNATDLFGSFVAAGITVMIAVQVILNVAVVTATIPNTGVPLPFITYGGSSLAISMFSIGILLNISRYSKET
ncbi:MAG: putative lipid II flippase FtsW [Clostridiales bacterium]|nr:putative lipid II flippase FtsW [Clostridiales bacterium]